MNAKELIKLRLANQHLLSPSFTKPEDLVGWMGAVQSQDYAGAKWALASRLKSPLETEIDKAIDEGKILRTHVLRPTWHFVLPADIRWMIALTEPRISAYSAKYFRDLGLDKPILKRSNKIIAKALEQGEHLTKKEIADLLKKARINTNDLRLTFMIFRAELDQLVCNGARRGKQFTYALLDQRAPGTKLLKKDEALAEIGKRYFTSRGPATIKDLTWWSGLSSADARKAVEIITPQLKAENVNGETYYYDPALTVQKSSKSRIHLLPSWDEFTVAYKDRSLAIDPAFEKESGHGIFNPNIVANGQIIGTWKRTLKNNSVDIQTRYFSNPTKTILEKTSATAKAYAKFIGKQPTITILK
jgi:hypothetical protein